MQIKTDTSLIQIQPRHGTEYVSQGRAVLATDDQGRVHDDPRHGWFVHETRLLSRWRHMVNDAEPKMIASSNVEQHSWLGYYAFQVPGMPWEEDTGSGQMEPVSEETVEMRLSRTVGYGLHEDIDFKNFSQQSSNFELAIEVDADFADQAETTQRKREQQGELDCKWQRAGRRAWELIFDYRNSHRYSHQGDRGKAEIHRRLILRIENADSKPKFKDNKLIFKVDVKPLASWHACIKCTAEIEDQVLAPLYPCHDFYSRNTELDRKRRMFLEEATRFSAPRAETLAPQVVRTLEQAKVDLSALRLYDLDNGDHAWVMAAGLPIYVALFGRDVLTGGWGSSLMSRDILRGALAEMARWQGTKVDDWRDEQPGRMLHEAHTGPLASLGYNPRTRYYGATTTSSFYPVAVAELWHWTGDKGLVKPLLAPALRAMRWKDQYANLRGDNFSYYKSRSEQGNKNQGWKDSGDAIVRADGVEVEPPIATCEEQAYVYVSKLHMSEVLWFLNEKDLAKKLFHEALDLKERFNDAFWMEDQQFFAMGLDPKGRHIDAIASNPGHCLAAGIVKEEYVLPTARRLMSEELFSGWGVRTLSAKNPAFDPYSYHRGSVWPVEQGTFALGFMRYGLHEELHRLARAFFESAALFPYHRLPECFSGHARDAEHPFPALYPKANWPQAWSASSVFTLMQAMLGIYPFAPMNVLLVDPHLPDWLPEISLDGLRVGKATVSLRFYRRGEATHYEVLDKRGKLHIVRQPSPWSVSATYAERFRDAIESMVA
jgi:glycogen debranching enzyme